MASSTTVNVSSLSASPSPAPPCRGIDLTPLQEIESFPPLKFLLRDWQLQSDGLRQQVQHTHSQCTRAFTDAFYIFMFHLAFQGALLAVVVSHHQSLGCRNLWPPMSLSLLAAFPLAGAIWHKLRASKDLKLQLHDERSILRDLHGSIQRLKVSGTKFKLSSFETAHRSSHKALAFRMYGLDVLFGYPNSILIVFTAFTCVILVSCYRVLCHSSVLAS